MQFWVLDECSTVTHAIMMLDIFLCSNGYNGVDLWIFSSNGDNGAGSLVLCNKGVMCSWRGNCAGSSLLNSNVNNGSGSWLLNSNGDWCWLVVLSRCNYLGA